MKSIVPDHTLIKQVTIPTILVCYCRRMSCAGSMALCVRFAVRTLLSLYTRQRHLRGGVKRSHKWNIEVHVIHGSGIEGFRRVSWKVFHV